MAKGILEHQFVALPLPPQEQAIYDHAEAIQHWTRTQIKWSEGGKTKGREIKRELERDHMKKGGRRSPGKNRDKKTHGVVRTTNPQKGKEWGKNNNVSLIADAVSEAGKDTDGRRGNTDRPTHGQGHEQGIKRHERNNVRGEDYFGYRPFLLNRFYFIVKKSTYYYYILHTSS
jgi:hypothetical protein